MGEQELNYKANSTLYISYEGQFQLVLFEPFEAMPAFEMIWAKPLGAKISMETATDESIAQDTTPALINAYEADQMPMLDSMSILDYVLKNIKYPALAKENGITGTVVANFIVNENGSISDIKIVKDVGGGCGMVVNKILKNMPKVTPAKHKGRVVKTKMTLPVKFSLTDR